MPEPHPPNDALSDFQRARSEAAELLGLDIAHLTAADALRVDLVVVLRRAIDTATEDMFSGQPVDLARLQSAIERLTSLLPSPEQSQRADPRAALLELITTMREREAIGERAVEPIDVPTSDIVPPGERAECDPGPCPADDPKRPVVIEGEVVKPKRKASRPAPAAPVEDAVDLRYGYNTDPRPEPWREFCTDVEGVPLSGGRKYWGPV